MLQKVKDFLLSLASKWPFPAGIAVGYIGHPVIKLAIDVFKSVFA